MKRYFLVVMLSLTACEGKTLHAKYKNPHYFEENSTYRQTCDYHYIMYELNNGLIKSTDLVLFYDSLKSCDFDKSQLIDIYSKADEAI